MNKERLKHDFKNQLETLTDKTRVLHDETLDLWCLIDGYHDNQEELLEKADDVLDSVLKTKDLVAELNLIADLLKEKRNE